MAPDRRDVPFSGLAFASQVVAANGSGQAERQCITRLPWWLDALVLLEIGVIYCYRVALRDRIGRRCIFQPTCSHYAEQSLKRYGAIRGTRQAVQRLGRCNASKSIGGHDPA